MAEVKSGIPTFSFLEPKKVVRTYETEVQCLRNLAHGKFKSLINVYEDGTEQSENGCPECEKEWERAAKAQHEKELLQHYKDCNIEPEFYGKKLNDFKAKTPSQVEALNSVQDMIDGKISTLVLLGGYGTGKTMLGSILADMFNGKIYTMYEISTMIRQSYTIKAEKTELEIVNELASVSLLVFDEVGRTNSSSFNMNWLSYVYDKRHTRKLKTVFLGNGHLRKNCPDGGCEKCFENYMDGDVISRLRQDSKVINIVADDYRAGK